MKIICIKLPKIFKNVLGKFIIEDNKKTIEKN